MANGTFGGGSGTYLSPYIVEDAADLLALNEGPSLHYIQSQDIDLASISNWQGIGNKTTPFTGTFDGQNYNILNLKFNSTSSYSGLFNYVNDPGVVRNVHVKNATVVSTENYTGILFGYFNSSSDLENCTATGTIDAKGYTGGIVGSCSTSIYSCHFDGDIVATYDSGGIAGYCNGGIYGCTSKATISGSYQLGGVAGRIYRTNVQDCTFEGLIQATGSPVGGIFSNANRQSASSVRCLVISADITTSASNGNVYGISYGDADDCEFRSGTLSGNSVYGVTGGTANRCSNKGTVIGVDRAAGINGSYAYDCYKSGGDVITTGEGTTYTAGITTGFRAQRCYCSSNVEGIGSYVGGILATSSTSTSYYVSNSYFLGEHVKGSKANTSFIGRISAIAHENNSDNYAIETARIVLE